MLIRFIIAFALSGLLIACDDSPIIKTIEPSPYFPVYPNSIWTYRNAEGVISERRTKETYRLDQSRPAPGYDFSKYYVPIYENNEVWGYFIRDNGFDGPDFFEEVLRPAGPLFDSWKIGCDEDSGKFCIRRMVITRDTTISTAVGFFDDLIVTRDFATDLNDSAFDTWYRDRFYAYNVGLVREEETFFRSNGDTVVRQRNLINYQIDR